MHADGLALASGWSAPSPSTGMMKRALIRVSQAVAIVWQCRKRWFLACCSLVRTLALCCRDVRLGAECGSVIVAVSLLAQIAKNRVPVAVFFVIMKP